MKGRVIQRQAVFLKRNIVGGTRGGARSRKKKIPNKAEKEGVKPISEQVHSEQKVLSEPPVDSYTLGGGVPCDPRKGGTQGGGGGLDTLPPAPPGTETRDTVQNPVGDREKLTKSETIQVIQGPKKVISPGIL